MAGRKGAVLAKPRDQGWFSAAFGRIEEGLAQARPALELMRAHRPTMRAWARYRGAIAEIVGDEEAELYTELVVTVSRSHGETARILALTIPDQLPKVAPEQRNAYFRLLREVAGSGVTALPLVARALPNLVGTMQENALREFLLQGMALHEQSATKAESFFRRESEIGRSAARNLQKGLALSEVSRTLGLYARAHCGEDVQIRPGAGSSFSDGHHIYLPENMDRFGDDRDFTLYRVLTALSAAYLEFGTFDLRLDQMPGTWPEASEGEGELERFFRSFPMRTLARDLFGVLEDHRIEARLRKEYPGIARDLDALGEAVWPPRPEPDTPVNRVVEALHRRARGQAPLQLSPEEEATVAPLFSALGTLNDAQAVAMAVQAAYGPIYALMRKAEPAPKESPPRSGARNGVPGPSGRPNPQTPPPSSQRVRPEMASGEDRQVEEQARRLWEAEERSPTEARREVRRRKVEAERSYAAMEAALERNPPPGGALMPEEEEADSPRRPASARPELDADLLPGERRFHYREWDSGIEDYKPNWVTVHERRLKDGSQSYVDEVMRRHHHRVAELRRRFEALRPEAMLRQTRLTDGDELDLDRVVEERMASRAGGERSERIYTRDQRARRDVAVAFLLDMSSSTNESADGSSRRIIDVEKEALILAAEALHALGDPFAIFGFSGYGRSQVVFYVAKDFGEPWDDRARSRIGRINFKMENRDGAAIRHATARLSRWPARMRLLIHISDGKPLDCGCDHYYDRYAQDDTRAALREARKAGVHPFCITVDPSARAYLPRMFGEVAYTVIDRVELLPSRLVQVYKRLAT